ncbi:MAG: hypothetical protein JF631_09560 [Mycobacterium sp.]|nr:hypothetical protein [Mycobacterium sp.]
MKSFTSLVIAAGATGAATLGLAGVAGSVRPGQTFSRMDSGSPGAMNDIVTTVTAMTVYVDVAC